ncbi:16S rRNA (cytosine(1402)-N(4))-methyltransferase RsmH [Candidatus Phytoplasma solani]|uniref:Ribosomal RNA small subunit methyltransferase H n=1 Tax=Candidatus Phytoplasma solani TaxID=69896 RepID=A0A421NYC4_9MOLU|nr:16S rRNA (cytosine(1402)-N(4))-methyltransferase RsmH [Candidatus Phytoplasma solani]RMI89008.1 S-adenosyl-methyltransferase [Candidatus Phytoplasma solani]
MNFEHISVLKEEAISFLQLKSDGIYVDATLGQGGHSLAILNHLKDGFLYSFDQDFSACCNMQTRISSEMPIEIIHSNFVNLKEELAKRNVFQIDGILFDLGLSSEQIDDPQRGFSYLQNVSLDMRFDTTTQTTTAQDIVNDYSFEKLKKIFKLYGEEKKAALIAQEIINRRPLHMSHDLVAITDIFYRYHKGHSAKKIFQALRIEVNQELEVLQKVLSQSLNLLKKEGRMVVISFHSLEDRIVKHFFKKNSILEIPQKLPIKQFEYPLPPLSILTKRAILPSADEMKHNSRSISAKLRVAIKNF